MLCQIPIISNCFSTLRIAVPDDICDKLKQVVEGYTNHISAAVYGRG